MFSSSGQCLLPRPLAPLPLLSPLPSHSQLSFKLTRDIHLVWYVMYDTNISGTKNNYRLFFYGNNSCDTVSSFNPFLYMAVTSITQKSGVGSCCLSLSDISIILLGPNFIYFIVLEPL